jgi:predicted DsbA family dithiol-disulfide isomerase|tara:strand:- start:2353 stop:2973 length:621 start_codon:yes stop_codon:yes gene_type:complete
MKIKVFSDTVCGWCYIGHTRLLKAVKNFKNTSFIFEYVPFLLNPDMPKKGISRQDYLKYKFGSQEVAKPMYENMVLEAQKENIKLNLQKIKITPNTNFSHILIKIAFSKNIGHEVLSKTFETYFCKGENIGDKDVLVKIGKSSNINEKEIHEAFSSKQESEAINKSDTLARGMGINGVPFFEINNKTYVSGAQSTTNLIEAIKANL